MESLSFTLEDVASLSLVREEEEATVTSLMWVITVRKILV
jgi:hypothetical protein